MCGRVAVTLPNDAMAQVFDAVPANDLPDVPNFNVCPTTQIAVAFHDGMQRRMRAMRWGFIPHWYKAPNDGPLLINARAETIAEKPAFRQACRQRRCLIAVDGFYEWTKAEDGSRLPWWIYRQDGAPMVFASIWQDWDKGDDTLTTCAVVTTQAKGEMADLHHRQPVILEPEQFGLWLGEEGKGAARLMTAGPEGRLAYHRVNPAVNSNRAAGPDLIEPFDGD